MKFFVFVFSLLFVVALAEISFQHGTSDVYGRTSLRAFRVRRDWSDRMVQATGNSFWKCSFYSYPDCLTL
ncbi:hypothetical protein L596_027178 [Steinernema carpocapsae]|uniref:Conotoxin n=1 Tax=Steinernema carpocapsae TaxID=34508 RepID=A0A4U5M3J8_STECR|nr:hypothetical protein L596_027178 [Steinernema carpocapsae]